MVGGAAGVESDIAVGFYSRNKRRKSSMVKIAFGKFLREGPQWTHSILPIKSMVVSVSCSPGENLFFF